MLAHSRGISVSAQPLPVLCHCSQGPEDSQPPCISDLSLQTEIRLGQCVLQWKVFRCEKILFFYQRIWHLNYLGLANAPGVKAHMCDDSTSSFRSLSFSLHIVFVISLTLKTNYCQIIRHRLTSASLRPLMSSLILSTLLRILFLFWMGSFCDILLLLNQDLSYGERPTWSLACNFFLYACNQKS